MSKKSPKKTDLSQQVTEEKLIDAFSDVFLMSKKPLLSGSESDDCAAIDLSFFSDSLNSSSSPSSPFSPHSKPAMPEFGNKSLVLSTDSVRQKTDFPPSMTFWQMGWMSAAVNLSDVAAMGANPIAFLAAVGLPPVSSLENAKELAAGIQDCVSLFGAEVIGGDTEFCEEVRVTGTVVGVSDNNQIVYRKNAKPGDLLCVTGYCGSAAVALDVLLESDAPVKKDKSKNNDKRKTKSKLKPKIDASPSFLKNLTEPFPRVFEGRLLSKTGALTSMMDTSDGLAVSVHELAKMSGVGFIVDANKIPMEEEAFHVLFQLLSKSTSSPAKIQKELLEKALYIGGDYELLFTVSPDKLHLVEEAFDKFNADFGSDFSFDSGFGSGSQFQSQSQSRLGQNFGKSGRFPCLFSVIGKAVAGNEILLKTNENGKEQQIPLLKRGYGKDP
ncbi:thiamine-phosphate kinase [Methanolapillus ohkumae]|uniref:Thiamine-monophosphate kinase n=1 Tax=Methanolapillus ohkumae TaxID=3028298 RepID=A0AA97A538_9EURY|nr:Thiamine-monophosphate kinase [Methanosarcinaceae archaeon Am2]